MKFNTASSAKTISIFLFFTMEFYLVCWLLIPLASKYVHTYVAWYSLGGVLTMLPLFLTAVLLARAEKGSIWQRLRLRPLTRAEWKTSWQGLGLVVLLSGLMTLALKGFFNLLGAEFSMDPAFMTSTPFEPQQWYIPLLWLFFFSFNILGEELLWRGYLQSADEERLGYKAWILNSVLWCLFHAAFGYQMMLMLIPTLIIVPLYVYKTKNTWTGVFIHGVFNGSASIFLLLKGFGVV